jgi:hypothetical protein
VLEGNTAEEEGDYARHGHAVREEVAGVRAESDEARLNGGVKVQRGVLEDERHPKAKGNAERHGHAEREQENSNALEYGTNKDFFGPMELRQRSMRSSAEETHSSNKWRHALVHDDTDSIVQQTLPKDNSVQFWVDFVLVENGKDGDWVRGG